MGSLEGKRALVTGGASGIGRAIALAFAADGAHVAVADRAPAEKIEAVVAEIGAGGGCAFAVQADVADEGQVLRMVETVLARCGGLDVLVNNAGILIEKPLLETTAEDFDRVIGVNLRGAFLVGREALRVMARQGGGGRVINVASELAYLGRENCSIYCASKGGVLSMTRSWAREFAPDILVNALAPGPTDTPMLGAESTSPASPGEVGSAAPTPHLPEMLAKETQNPLGRLGRPEEIASAAVFLAGAGATFITGQCLSPNGGAVMF
jgi:3-oxoacyl-[acyl-carrier protein] reductase